MAVKAIMFPVMERALSATDAAFAPIVMVLVVLTKASSDNINPLLVLIKLCSY